MQNLSDDGKIKYKFLDIEDKLIDNLIEQIQKIGDQEYSQSIIKGAATGYDTHYGHFKTLKKVIKRNVPFKIKHFANIWAHMLTDNNYVTPHNHLEHPVDKIDWSTRKCFVLYLQAPEGCGKIYFNDYDLEITPLKKLFLYFEPDVFHEVLPNDAQNITRIACAGNLILAKI